jgi:hypothetical protein
MILIMTVRAPAGLGVRGRALWRDTLAAYQLDPLEQMALLQICRRVDELDRIDLALRGAKPTTTGSTGQTVANPLLAEVRAHSETLRNLTKLMNLPEARKRATREPKLSGRVNRISHMHAVPASKEGA